MQTMYSAQINSPYTTIAADVTASATSITVADGTKVPAAPNILVIGEGEIAETISYSGKSGNTLTGVTRGFQGSAQSWVSGTMIARYFTAYDHDAFKANIEELNTSKAAITYVDTKVASIVNSAPATLDTLNELAYALGNDPNFATTVATQIGLKANSADVYTKTESNTLLAGKLDSTANAVSATKLATARTINGVAFDGQSNITVADATKLPLAGGVLTGGLTIAGNVGIGTSDIESWYTGYTALQIGKGTSIFTNASSSESYLNDNVYFDGAWKYRTTAGATSIKMFSGDISFKVATSGTIDTTVSWVEPLKLYADGSATFGGEVSGAKFKITPEGGYAIKLTAGEALNLGEVVYINQAGANGKVYKAPTSNDMPVGVVYANAAQNADVWVVVSGIASVLPESGITAARGYIAYTSTTAAGRVAQNASAPTGDHWREIGHFLDTGTGNGVATRAILHFN